MTVSSLNQAAHSVYSADIQRRLDRTSDYVSQQSASDNIISAKSAHIILSAILAHLKPGMQESELKAIAESLFTEHGIERIWHPPYVRFGTHTLRTFMDGATEDRVLGENDIAFVDIGIVKGGVEGDAGRTLAFGADDRLHQLAAASKHLFEAARTFWMAENPSGQQLYAFIHRTADTMGYDFILDPAGHLIGAYPHQGWKRGINHFPETIEAGMWILEIQLRHRELALGSFYEDLLY